MKKITWKSQIAEVKILDADHPDSGDNTAPAQPDHDTDVTFERAVWPILAVVQFCGILPVSGIRRSRSTPQSTAFKWLSVRVVYTLSYQAVLACIIYLYLQRLKENGFTAKRLAGCIVLIFSLACGQLFFLLARRWRALIELWNRTDAVFLRYPYGTDGYKLSTKVRCVAGVWLLMALVEHLVYLMQKVVVQAKQIERCRWHVEDRMKHFLWAEHNHIFERVPYSWPLAILVSWVNTIAIIGWSCADIFIMIVAVGLTQRFQQINRRVQRLQTARIVDESTWTEIRTHYVLVCELLDSVDDQLGVLIMLSCANNLCFICFQLLNIFDKLPYAVNYVYFWFSLAFLITRTVSVFLMAASINDASQQPATAIRTVRTADWTIEAERILDQVNNEQVALSGMKFFYLTRKVLLAMIGTIITYELVLLQFDKGDSVKVPKGADKLCVTSSRVT